MARRKKPLGYWKTRVGVYSVFLLIVLLLYVAASQYFAVFFIALFYLVPIVVLEEILFFSSPIDSEMTIGYFRNLPINAIAGIGLISFVVAMYLLFNEDKAAMTAAFIAMTAYIIDILVLYRLIFKPKQ